MTRAKFKVQSLERRETGENRMVETVRMHPVYAGSEENQKFFAATPVGSIEMTIWTPNLFEVGKEYYVDFTKAE